LKLPNDEGIMSVTSEVLCGGSAIARWDRSGVNSPDRDARRVESTPVARNRTVADPVEPYTRSNRSREVLEPFSADDRLSFSRHDNPDRYDREITASSTRLVTRTKESNLSASTKGNPGAELVPFPLESIKPKRPPFGSGAKLK